jgi:hypothetical protein
VTSLLQTTTVNAWLRGKTSKRKVAFIVYLYSCRPVHLGCAVFGLREGVFIFCVPFFTVLLSFIIAAIFTFPLRMSLTDEHGNCQTPYSRYLCVCGINVYEM